MGILSSPAITVLSSVAMLYSSWRLRCELRRIGDKLDRIWEDQK